MKIIADENITQVHQYFGKEGDLTVMPGRSIDANAVKDADVLLVRSVTRVDQDLLRYSRCKFVGTATSGIDHIDTGWLKKNGIGLGWARGCNAESVVDYVFSALASLSGKKDFDWRTLSYGIVGCGEVGSRLAKKLLALQCRVVIYDPFLENSHSLTPHFAAYSEVIQQDVITFHTPITTDLPWPTYHLMGSSEIRALSPQCILINAARGAVVDNNALLDRLKEHSELQVVLDAWEGEPSINLELLKRVAISTPHIAGYSREGKLNGTRMIHSQFSDFFGLKKKAEPENFAEKLLLDIDSMIKPLNQLNQLIRNAYDVMSDHADMQSKLAVGNTGNEFDKLRKTYPVRHEFSAFSVNAGDLAESIRQQARILGFTVLG
ncbi:MAG: 4-phosphoerythronate dehydrogenase [Pseudomonadota bacterium]